MPQEFALPHSLAMPGLNLDQYFGLWAIAVDPFQSLVERWNGINLHAHVSSATAQAAAASQARKSYDTSKDGVAVVDFSGPLMKSVSSMSDGTSLSYARRQIGLAANDPDVSAIMLICDSPGGTVAGTADVADAITQAKTKKPVMAFVEDRAASAMVWIASQAHKIYANQSSAVYGSIGVYATLLDQSKMAENLGVKVHVIRTGHLKGAGVPGDLVTPEQLADLQKYVDAVHDQFLNAVAIGRGRDIASIREHADGGIFTAASAVGRGLIDGVKTYEAAYAELVGMSQSRKKPASQLGARRMSDDPNLAVPRAATIAELRTACPGAPSDWLLAQLEAGATIAVAQAAFITLQSEQIEQARASAGKVAEETKAKSAGGLGVVLQSNRRQASTEQAEESSGDPIADFNAAVSAALPRCGGERSKAVQMVIRENPRLHRDYSLATNSSKAAPLIEDRFQQLARSTSARH
jgi:signal peptide peptidase SppA